MAAGRYGRWTLKNEPRESKRTRMSFVRCRHELIRNITEGLCASGTDYRRYAFFLEARGIFTLCGHFAYTPCKFLVTFYRTPWSHLTVWRIYTARKYIRRQLCIIRPSQIYVFDELRQQEPMRNWYCVPLRQIRTFLAHTLEIKKKQKIKIFSVIQISEYTLIYNIGIEEAKKFTEKKKVMIGMRPKMNLSDIHYRLFWQLRKTTQDTVIMF